MDLNDAPVGTVLSGTGQVLEQEVPIAGHSGIEPSNSSTLQPACMHPSGETTTTPTFTSSSSTTALTSSVPRHRPVSPSPLLPSSTTNPYSPSPLDSHTAEEDNDPPAPVMQSRTFQKVQQELEAQQEEESNNNNNSSESNSSSISSSVNISMHGFCRVV
ncbi:hypothetical protein ElyMa_003291400 [Elysia marginata]|uniref:Uncharacterized protein n=1 Tax=Elysia marginata TaxID=1093978 RepID=A0AAV4JCU4_9GAST|nr:hypothetical protein ElyMa_003291400 [Elysia marginata]